MLTPLGGGGTRYLRDGVVEVDAAGRIRRVSEWGAWAAEREREGRDGPVDLRPWLALPGMVDLHAHLPQFPNAGVGAGLDLLTWLKRYIYPLERDFDVAAAERLAPAAFRAFAATGTTTVVLYGAVYQASVEASFRAAEAHGIRAVIGKVLMDRFTYDPSPPRPLREVSLRESADLCARWHGRDGGRLRYAFSPRFAVSCSAEILRESAALAAATGAHWQTHLAEDRDELAEVARLFPEARDYLDVYDRAGALGPRTLLAHAIHLSEREVARLAESGARVAHCPASNLFLASGLMPLARYREAGIVVGLGSDVAAGPEASLFSVMRAGAYTQNALHATGHRGAALGPLDWLRLATLEGARALGIDDAIGSIESGKEADLIVLDPRLTAPPRGEDDAEPDELASRLVFRAHPEMVRGAWVRGRRLERSARRRQPAAERGGANRKPRSGAPTRTTSASS